MTTSQIKNILSETFGISSPMDKWIRLPQASIIFLSQDANLYLNDSFIFYFNSKDETMNISKYHKTDEILKSKLNDYKRNIITPFDKIGGFISSTVNTGAGLFLIRKF